MAGQNHKQKAAAASPHDSVRSLWPESILLRGAGLPPIRPCSEQIRANPTKSDQIRVMGKSFLSKAMTSAGSVVPLAGQNHGGTCFRPSWRGKPPKNGQFLTSSKLWATLRSLKVGSLFSPIVIH